MHDKEFLWRPRGFSNTKEMCEAIVERWNSVVKPEDTVYNLGDIALSDVDAAIPYLQKLNGIQWWIVGNHDTLNKITKITLECPDIRLIGTNSTSYATVIKSSKWSFYLSHYPTMTVNHEEWRKVANLCGHSHTQNKWSDWDKMCYHVEMDAHNCYPVSLEQIKEDIKNKHIEEQKLLPPDGLYNIVPTINFEGIL
jgi:calcineurin-like phosphoesterase family protein